MRLLRPLFIFGAVLGTFAIGAEIHSHNADAQLSVSKEGTLGGPIEKLPPAPTSSSKTPVPKNGNPPIGTIPTAKPVPTATPRPTPAPVLMPRFTGQKVIRVGLSTAGGSIAVYVPGGGTIYDINQPGLTLSLNDGDRLQFDFVPAQAVRRGNKVFSGPITISRGGQTFGGWQRAYIAVDGDNARVTTNNNSPRYGRPYRGDLEIFPQKLAEPVKRKGALALVNVVPLEEYLKGVVPWEMGPEAPAEALKAQAICARTKTLQFVETKKFAAGDFDICDYDACQGYPGTENEKPPTTAAVDATRGLALYQGNRPIDAVYSTNSGGITADAQDVWKATSPITYLQSVPDFPPDSPIAQLWKDGMTEAEWVQFCANDYDSYARPNGVASSRYEARKYRWTEFISVADAQKAFANRGFDQITGFEVVVRANSGRIKQLRVVGVSKNSPVLAPDANPAADIQTPKFITLEGDGKIRAMFSGWLGSTTALPSSLFTVSPQTNAAGALTGWNFVGAGWGHGVGMCQRGAQNHAKDGWDARRILNWYYKNVQIRKIG